MKKLNNKGFSTVEVVIVLVVIGLLSLVGCFVYGRQNSKNQNDYSAANTTNTEQSEAQHKTDLLAESITFNAPDNSFSVKYPKDWLTKTCPYTVSSGAYLGLALKSNELLQACDAQPKPIYGFVIYFQSYPAPSDFDNNKDDDNYSSIDHKPYNYESAYSHTKVNLNGKTIDKQLSVHKTSKQNSPMDDPIKGATVTKYRYYDGKKLWFAVYTNLAGSEDLTDYFEAMVNSWTIN